MSTTHELLNVLDNAINVLTDLDGRGLVAAERTKELRDELTSLRDSATAASVVGVPESLLRRLSADRAGVEAALAAYDAAQSAAAAEADAHNDSGG